MRFYARIFGDKGTTSTKTSSPLTGDPAKPCDSLPRQSQQCPCWIPGAKTPWNKLGKNLVKLPAGMCGHLLFPCCSHTDLVQHRQNTRCGIHKDSVSWMPCSADTLMPWKAGAADSIVGGLWSRDSLLRRRAHRGSLLQTGTPNTPSFQVKYNHNTHLHYISEKCLAYSWLFEELISIYIYGYHPVQSWVHTVQQRTEKRGRARYV